MKKESISLRRLNNSIDDYKKLEDWYQQKDVYLNFEQRILTYDEIKSKYFPRTFKNAIVPVYMIEFDDTPIGIIQYQLINEENKKLYNIKDNDNNYEIDIFIGELDYHNKGIGNTSINLLCDYLFKEKGANNLVMCPLKNNVKAIKCYEKCGFEKIREYNANDTIGEVQTYFLMINKNK